MPRNELESLMNTMFLGYKYRKSHDLLYSKDAAVPISLIKMYYSGLVDRLDVNEINKSFVERYIKNECFLEDVHNIGEVAGVGVMYEHMHNLDEYEFELFSIIELHKALYSKSEHPEFGGVLRNTQAVLKDCPIDVSYPDNIFMDLINLEDDFNELKKEALIMNNTQDYDNLTGFVKKCMILKSKLLQVHPFGDGNGRVIRCFINKLFLMAGIPPVYIAKDEKEEYKRTLYESQRYRNAGDIDDDSKYDQLTNFYLYKICDSIIELDINKSVREEKKYGYYEKKKTKS